MENKFFIYVYANQINGKIYIGQTNDLDTRDYTHTFYGRQCMPIDCAIQKYGRSNFELFTIAVVDTEDQANQEEMYWIAEMRRMLGKENVYNLADGGSGPRGVKRSEESRRKMSEAKSREKHPHFGKKQSEERKQKTRGENSVRAKLTNDDVKEIRRLYAAGNHTSRQLGEQFDVGKTTILRVLKNESWHHIENDQYDWVIKALNENVSKKFTGALSGTDNPNAKLNYVIAEDIRVQYAMGRYTFKQLAEKFGVGATTIGRVIRNELWTEAK